MPPVIQIRGRARVALAATAALALAIFAGCSQRSEQTHAWASLPLGTDAEFRDLYFADSLNGWIVGGGYSIRGGVVGRTRDGGRTWRYISGIEAREPGSAGFNLEAVEFLDSLRGFVAADGGKIFRTGDGGDSWRLVRAGEGLLDHLFDMEFLDDRQGWAIGLGGLLATRDGGETWAAVGKASPDSGVSFGRAIHFMDARNGWLAGRNGTLMRTSDGGVTWKNAVTPFGEHQRPALYELCFTDLRNGWAVGEEGTILHTSDGGATWSRQDAGLPGAESAPRPGASRNPDLVLTAVRFMNARRGWITGHLVAEGRSVMLRTDNGGAAWRVEAEAPGEELRSLFLLDGDHVWAVGDRVREGSQVLLRRAPVIAKRATGS